MSPGAPSFRALFPAVLLLAVSAPVVSPALADEPCGEPENNFIWWEGFSGSALDGNVRALTMFQGSVVAAGEFGSAGGVENTDAVGIDGTPSAVTLAESGAAYVFARDAGTWSQQAFLKASNPGSPDRFGASLDISDDGNIITVGAPGEASASQGVGGDQNDDSTYATGAVYSFRREGSTWTQLNYLHAYETDLGDMLGISMGLSADGKSLIVGAYGEDAAAFDFNPPGDDDSAPESGAAYIF